MSALWLGLKWDFFFFFVLHRSGELVMDWNERDSDEKLLNCPLLVSERLLYSWPPPKRSSAAKGTGDNRSPLQLMGQPSIEKGRERLLAFVGFFQDPVLD